MCDILIDADFLGGRLGGIWQSVVLHLATCVLIASIPATMGDKTVDALHPFDNAEVAFCARAECLKSLFVSLAFVGGQRSFVTVKFDNDRSLLQA